MRAEDGGIEAVVSACLTSDDVRREQSATLDARQIKMRVRRRVQNDGGMARTRSGARREAIFFAIGSSYVLEAQI